MKHLDQTDGFRKFKIKLRQFIGKEPKMIKDIDLKTECWNGWDLVSSLMTEGDIMYSFGVCDDIGFDLTACKKGVKVFAFDPTPYSVDWIAKQKLPPSSQFQFFPWAVAENDGNYFLYPRIMKKGKKSSVMYTFHQQGDVQNEGVKVRALTPGSMAKELGHESIDIIKMDIEGAEYEVIDSLLASNLRPKMLLIEFHHRFKGVGKEKTIASIHSLREAGYLLVSVSLTNTEFCFINKNNVPDGQ